jgi:hypothetical protein
MAEKSTKNALSQKGIISFVCRWFLWYKKGSKHGQLGANMLYLQRLLW